MNSDETRLRHRAGAQLLQCSDAKLPSAVAELDIQGEAHVFPPPVLPKRRKTISPAKC